MKYINIEKNVRKDIKKRTKILYFFISIAILVILFSLFYVYFFKSKRYSEDALKNHPLVDNVIKYKRGEIQDRNGIVLAKSEVAYNIILDSYQLHQEENNYKKNNKDNYSFDDGIVANTFDFLSKEYGISFSFLKNFYSEHPDSKYEILKKDVDTEKVKTLQYLLKYDKKFSKSGIWLENKYNRIYPFKDLASNVIGFINTLGDPIIGIESEYNEYLRGKNGRDYQYLDKNLGIVGKKILSKDGDNIVLTLDISIQKIITDQIKEYYKKDKYKNMAILVMNPSNGEVLGMASTPLFDLNDPYDHTDIKIPYKIEKNSEGKEIKVKQQWSDLSEKKQSELLNKKWENYVVSNAFEPGSTFKPITFSAGLELKKYDLDTEFYCDGGEQIADRFIACSNRNGHGRLTAAQAIEKSCNDSLMQMARMIGKKEFLHYQHLFNFGKKTGIDLPNEVGDEKMLHDMSMSSVDLATNSFGQNFLVNMVQLACADGSIGNNGRYYRPHLLSLVKDDRNNIIKKYNPIFERQVISKDVATKTKEAMRMVVEETYIKKWGIIKGYEHQLFGKTGSAEKLPRDSNKYICSFIEMAPFDNPDVLVYVVIDEPESGTAATANATRITTEIMKQILPSKNKEIKKE